MSLDCIHCGHPVLQLIRQDGLDATFRCERCSGETATHATLMLERYLAEEQRVIVRWKQGRATAAELAAFRPISPEHAAMPAIAVRAAVGDAPSISLGPFQAGVAVDLADRLRAAGLVVDLADA